MNGLNMPDYYQLLGLSYDAEGDDITRSYQSVCEKFSIFLYSSRDEIIKINKDLVVYKDAYDTLSDKNKKNKYDSILKNAINQKAVELENTHLRIISDTSDLQSSIFQDSTIKLELSRVKDDILTDNFTRGKEFLNNGQYHEAINIFRKLINMKQKEAKFHSYLALALEKKGWTAYAEEEFKTAIELDPEDVAAKKYFESKLKHITTKKTSLLNPNEALEIKSRESFIDSFKRFFKRLKTHN